MTSGCIPVLLGAGFRFFWTQFSHLLLAEKGTPVPSGIDFSQGGMMVGLGC